MAQLVVRKLEEAIVQKLRNRAAKAGVSMEEEHRRILRNALRDSRKARSFKEHLLSIPESNDTIFERKRTHQSSQPPQTGIVKGFLLDTNILSE